jgi:hypothetical protein
MREADNAKPSGGSPTAFARISCLPLISETQLQPRVNLSAIRLDVDSRSIQNPNHRRFHPPRFPGAPPVDLGAGPNSGPDSRELVGWKIFVPPTGAGFCGRVRVPR